MLFIYLLSQCYKGKNFFLGKLSRVCQKFQFGHLFAVMSQIYGSTVLVQVSVAYNNIGPHFHCVKKQKTKHTHTHRQFLKHPLFHWKKVIKICYVKACRFHLNLLE